MGWKGTLRSVSAELKRQSREADKRQRLRMKELERLEAADAVAKFENYLESIISLHHECRASLNWKSIENEPEPIAPTANSPLTDLAARKLKSYRPNIVAKLLKLESRRKRSLLKNIEKAKLKDQQNFIDAKKKYQSAKTKWEKDQELVARLKSDGDAVIEILQEHLKINDLLIGRDVQFEVSDEMQVDINLNVLPYEDVIPDEIYSLRQSGTLSTKKMPKGRGLELYQDHICSALMRVARETLGALPFASVRANALVNAINTQTGHLEDQIIISAIIVKETLHQINFKYIDPSDSFNNFLHNMNLKKTKGFSAVEKISFP